MNNKKFLGQQGSTFCGHGYIDGVLGDIPIAGYFGHIETPEFGGIPIAG